MPESDVRSVVKGMEEEAGVGEGGGGVAEDRLWYVWCEFCLATLYVDERQR